MKVIEYVNVLGWKNILIFLLTGVIVLLILFQPKHDRSKEVELQTKIELREKAIHSISRDFEKLKAKIDRDSVRFTKSVQDKVIIIKEQSRRISDLKKNPEVVTVIAENPLVFDLINSYDSIIIAQSEQIQLQARHIDTLRVDLKQIEANFQERIDLQSESIADLTGVTSDQRKQLRKIRRTARLFKIISVVGAVGGLFVGSSL